MQLTSLHIGIPDLVLGALEVKNLAIDYTQTGEAWAGSATIYIPAGTPYFGIAARRSSICPRRSSPPRPTASWRTIDAIISDNGVQREIVAVASYRAPGPLTPTRVRDLRVARHARQFRIGFGTASGASYYLLTVRANDGRDLLRLIGRAGHSLTLPVLGYSDHLTVTVLGVSVLGRRGPATAARI